MIIWLMCVCGSAALFTGIGVYAMRRQEPMLFWSGTAVARREITDVPAYNRANGIMWLAYSVLFWLAGIGGLWSPAMGGSLLGIACTAGIAALVIAYWRIYKRYAVSAQRLSE